MSIFETIKNAIFGHHVTPPAAGAPSSAAVAPAAGTTGAGAASAPPPTAAAGAAPTASTISSQDLQAQLAALAAKNPQKLNWQTSIVDLMKLVGLDPSLANRKTLAHELGYTGNTDDSAAMNIWLHKEVMAKLAQSGGKVPGALH